MSCVCVLVMNSSTVFTLLALFCYFNLLKETSVSLVAKHFTVLTSSVFPLAAVGQVVFNGILEIFHRKDLSLLGLKTMQ